MAAPDVQVPRRRPQLALRLLVLAGAVTLGLGLQAVVGSRLEELQALAKQDPIRARAELASLLRVFGLPLFALTGAIGLAMAASARRALATLRFPPPGIWSWGATRFATGPRARTLALVGLALAALLLLCSAAGAAVVWEMAARLLACRAT